MFSLVCDFCTCTGRGRSVTVPPARHGQPSLGTRDCFLPPMFGSPLHLCPNTHLAGGEILLKIWASFQLYFPSNTNAQQSPELIEKEEFVLQRKKGFDLRD